MSIVKEFVVHVFDFNPAFEIGDWTVTELIRSLSLLVFNFPPNCHNILPDRNERIIIG